MVEDGVKQPKSSLAILIHGTNGIFLSTNLPLKINHFMDREIHPVRPMDPSMG